MKVLTAIPVYNEARHVESVLREVRRYSPHILVVNDGSTDGTADILARQDGPGGHHAPGQPRLRRGPDLGLRLRPPARRSTCW